MSVHPTHAAPTRLPAGYEIIALGGLQMLRADGRCVSIFAASAPAAQIAAVALRDAARREGISSRDLHIALAVASGDGADELGRRWGVLPQQIASIAAAVSTRLWPTTPIEERPS